MILGNWQLDSVSGGKLRIDGGSMFGVVPKALWEKLQPADAANRIRCNTNCILARSDQHAVLVDTGYGGKESARTREVYSLESGEPLVASLAALSVAPEQITAVVFTHLHFDHAGGASRLDANGRLELVFPHAKYYVQQAEWRDATSAVPELKGAYPQDNLRLLETWGRLNLLHGPTELFPGLSVIPTGGHTLGHQAVRFQSGGETAICLGDLCPMTSHMRALWGMAYDVDPLETRRRKPKLLGQAADEGWWIWWDHDPDYAACKLVRDEKTEFRIREPIAAP